MNAEEFLQRSWDRKYEEKWKKGLLTVKEFPAENGLPAMTIVNNSLRDKWEANKKTESQKREKGLEKCPLDNPVDLSKEYVNHGSLYFRININPTLRNHLFIKILEHRERPTAEDNLSAMEFVDETDYALYLNLRGSGAGIPDHLHYQGQKRENFPLLRDFKSEKIYSTEDFELSRLDGIAYALLFKYQGEKGRRKVAEALGNMDAQVGKYNLLFDDGEVFLFPRPLEVASGLPKVLLDAGADKWGIAGQEMGFLFNAKYKSILENVNHEMLANILESVTLNDRERQRELEDMARMALQ